MMLRTVVRVPTLLIQGRLPYGTAISFSPTVAIKHKISWDEYQTQTGLKQPRGQMGETSSVEIDAVDSCLTLWFGGNLSQLCASQEEKTPELDKTTWSPWRRDKLETIKEKLERRYLQGSHPRWKTPKLESGDQHQVYSEDEKTGCIHVGEEEPPLASSVGAGGELATCEQAAADHLGPRQLPQTCSSMAM
ncbi:hypothetical protein MG293_002531 [Ovis ammon polii]|uniref:Uncharacterized protein n=1 Tax=Ovis ammon polii TaxID=230172 RepID=A0AAD4UH90_OVIAM|nr:hypothetical protein MG293_002531 [Ovis ammon polii]KAI4576229.1 hypothetical protein MJT46_002064 [Ovis ammon polii x Ovis aries]